MSKIVSIRKVANGSLQAEIVGTVQKPGSVNALQMLNKGDERFATGSQRRAWFPVTLAGLVDLGFKAEQLTKIEALSEKEKFECEVLNPQVNGESLEIQVRETITPDEYQRANVMSTAKRIMIDDKVAANKGINSAYDLSQYKGQNGYFLDKDGNHIFSRTVVTIASQVRHVFVTGELVPEKELANFGATLAEPKEAFVDSEA